MNNVKQFCMETRMDVSKITDKVDEAKNRISIGLGIILALNFAIGIAVVLYVKK